MKKDFIITFATEFIVLISGIVVYKLAVSYLGKEGFSEYALSRRTVSLIQPALIMGLGVGIPRYIASATTAHPQKSDTYFVGGISILIFVVLTSTAILNIFKDRFAFLLFGSSNYTYFIFPISLMLIGLILHVSCYSYFRGSLLMLKANLLQMINIESVPLFAFTMGKTTEQILEITGVSWMLISGLFLFLIMKNLKWERKNVLPCTKELIAYGLQRVPGDFGLAALLTLPATFTAHMAGIKEAGNVAFGISLFNMAGSVFAPIGLIFLPKASQIISTKDYKLLKYYIFKLLKITLLLTTTGIVFFEVFADEIITLYLGEGFSDIVLITRIIMISAIAYTVYVSMRSILDAYYVKAVNTINIIFSLILFLLFSGVMVLFSMGYIYIIPCFILAIFSLGGLTLFEIKKILQRENHAP